MDNLLYSYSTIYERPHMAFPGGKKLAFYVGLNIEHFHVDMPRRKEYLPDPRDHGQHEYGTRVGIWRMFDLFDEVGLHASAITNSQVCSRYPQIIEAGVERNWAWIAHGQTNSIRETNMTDEAEERFLKEMVAEFDAALPARPKGWLGPGLTETFQTPRILRSLGFSYLLDWCCDDQPFEISIPGMISVPYTMEVNDVTMWGATTLSGQDYEQIVLDQFEVLLSDAQKTGRVMALPLHTYVTGQPHLFKYLARVLHEICSNDNVWLCTSDDIAEHYLATANEGGALDS